MFEITVQVAAKDWLFLAALADGFERIAGIKYQ
jgi:hypothetical protein